MSDEAPFRCKGLVYRGARAYYEAAVPGGVAAVIGALADPARAALLGDGVVAVGWYDVLPIVPISQAAARLCGLSHAEMVRRNARFIAERDIRGVYRLLLKLASPRMVATRLPRASMQYFSFGSSSGTLVGDGRLEAVQHGIPEALASWMIAAVTGFAPYAIELAGGGKCSVRTQPAVYVNEVAGLRLLDLHFTLIWA
jgi:hypothetical protein